jgi:hypothetical protein
MLKSYRSAAILAVPFILTSAALAEIADKMPTSSDMWSTAGWIAAVSFAVACYKPLIGILVLIVTDLFSAGMGVVEFNGDYPGAVAREMGNVYLREAIYATLLPVLSTLLGITLHLLWRRWKARRVPPNPPLHTCG